MVVQRYEYMCTACGKKVVRSQAQGRPEPGSCPRKTGNRGHSWTKNRKLTNG